MNKWSGLLGFVGLVVLLFGVAGGLVIQNFALPLIVAHLVVGALLLIAWFTSAGSSSLGQAGRVAMGRTARFSLNATLYTVVFIGILTVINFLAQRYDKRWDLTEQGVYSLSPQSEEIFSGLKKPLKLVALKGVRGQSDDDIDQLLKLYSHQNPSKVTIDSFSPRSKPHLADTYEMKQGNLLYIEYGEGETKGVSRINEVTEEAVTNAVLKLTRGEAKKIYFAEGYGGPSLQNNSETGLSQLKSALGDEHLSVESIFLAQKGSIPEDAAAVVLVSPERALPPAEIQMLTKYAEDGGRLLLFHDPRTGTAVKELAQHFGIKVDDDVMVDLTARILGGEPIQVLAADYGQHAITRALSANNTAVLLELASSVRPLSEIAGTDGAAKTDKDSTYTSLVKSSQASWGETDLAALFDPAQPRAEKEATDIPGPLSLAVAYEKKISPAAPAKEPTDEPAKFEKVARVVVVGDSDFIQNQNLGFYGNRDFVLNMVGWLAGEEGGITVRPKSMRASVALIGRDQFLTILAASLLVPELLLLFGLFVWWRRKTVETFAAAA